MTAIRRANGGKTRGCFDVLALKDSDYALVESKRQLKDSIPVLPRTLRRVW
jgi:Holliday junction resolvase